MTSSTRSVSFLLSKNFAIFRSVFAEDVHVELCHVGRVIQADDVLEHAVVGDVMSGGLAHAFVTFAGKTHDIDTQLFLHLPRHGMHVVADEADRAGGKNGDRLRLEYGVSLANRLSQFLFTAENNLVFLHIRVHAVLQIIRRAFRRSHQIPAGLPGVIAAAHGAVRDLEQVVDRPHHHAAAAGVSAAALRDDARHRARVRADFRRRFRVVEDDLFGAFLRRLGGIDFQHLRLYRCRIRHG